MHDMRKKALNESFKTTSRKARKRPESLAGSNNSSRHASTANSRAGSRYASEDEDSGLSSAVSNLRLRGHTPTKGKARSKALSYQDARDSARHTPEESSSEEEEKEDEMEELSDGELADNASLWKANFRGVLSTLEDRKRANLDRVNALTKYGQLLRAIYSSEAVARALPSILEQLLKSIRKGSGGAGGEQQLALEGLSLTILSCASDIDAMNTFEQAVPPVKRLVTDPDSDAADKATALQTLAMLVVFGSGLPSTGQDLLDFLLKIVESDGSSVSSPDSGAVVTAAIQMWSFMASLAMPAESEPSDDALDEGDEADNGYDEDDDEDDSDGEPVKKPASRRSRRKAKTDDPVSDSEESDGGAPDAQDSDDDSDDDIDQEDYFERHGQRALDIFIEQLESTDPNVQSSAGVAIALIYEASRNQEEIGGQPLDLRPGALETAQQFKDLASHGTRSVKSIKRQGRREIRDIFSQLVTSLEYGVGPEYSPHTHKSDAASEKKPASRFNQSLDTGDEEVVDTYVYSRPDDSKHEIDPSAYHKRVVIGDKAMPITTWRQGVRVDTFKAILGNGMSVHLLRNRKVRHMLWASRLRKLAAVKAKEKAKSAKKPRASKTAPSKRNTKGRDGD